jgi:hypothetical protein
MMLAALVLTTREAKATHTAVVAQGVDLVVGLVARGGVDAALVIDALCWGRI